MLVARSVTSNFAFGCPVGSLGVVLRCVLVCGVELVVSESRCGKDFFFFLNQDFDGEVFTEQGALITQMADYICRLFCSGRQGIFCPESYFSLGRENL